MEGVGRWGVREPPPSLTLAAPGGVMGGGVGGGGILVAVLGLRHFWKRLSQHYQLQCKRYVGICGGAEDDRERGDQGQTQDSYSHDNDEEGGDRGRSPRFLLPRRRVLTGGILTESRIPLVCSRDDDDDGERGDRGRSPRFLLSQQRRRRRRRRGRGSRAEPKILTPSTTGQKSPGGARGDW
jgi:hypothetical protein